MKQKRPLMAMALAAFALAGFGAPASAGVAGDPPSDQSGARKEMRAGNAMKARELEERFFRVVRMPICRKGESSQGNRCIEYLRYDYDETANAYRFKYILNSRVEYVDLDARTGRVLNRSR